MDLKTVNYCLYAKLQNEWELFVVMGRPMLVLITVNFSSFQPLKHCPQKLYQNNNYENNQTLLADITSPLQTSLALCRHH